MSKVDVANKKVEKIKQLDPDDPVRRGLLETLADWILGDHKRDSHNWHRYDKREKRLKY